MFSKENNISILIFIATFWLLASLYQVKQTVSFGAVVFVVTALLCAYLIHLKKEKIFQAHFLFYGFWILYAFRIIGLLWTDELKEGIKVLETQSSLLIFPLVFSLFKPSPKLFKSILFALLTEIFIFSWINLYHLYNYYIQLQDISILDYIREAKNHSGVVLKAWAAYFHYSFLSIHFLLAIPVSFYFFLTHQNKTRILCFINFIFFTAIVGTFILFSGSRIGLVILPIILTFCLVYAAYFRKTYQISKIFLNLFSFIILFLVTVCGYFIKNSSYSFSQDEERKILRELSLEKIAEKPILGHGTNGLEIYYYNHSHNQYIEEFLRFGILGGSFFILFLCAIFWYGLKRQNFLLVAFWLINILFMLVEAVLITANSVVFTLFFFCLFIGNGNTREKKPNLAKNKFSS